MQIVNDLSKLKEGKEATVEDIYGNDNMRRRLQDLGLIKGAKVFCVLKSPLGDPIAYQIQGAVIAIRKEDSSCVQIKNCEV